MVLLPLAVVFLTSLKSYGEISDGQGALALPDDWLNFSNYATAFNDGHMLQAFGNTAFILLFSITGTVIIGSMTAYAIDRFDFRFKKLVMALFLIATLVPAVTTQVATFQVVNSFGLFNTRWAPILLYMGTDIVAIYIFLQFIRGIPKSLDEAARLDGANSFTIYRKNHLPAAQAGHRDRGHHQGHHHVQRLLHPLPLHARRGPRNHVDGPVPVQRAVRGALGEHLRGSRSRHRADAGCLPVPPALHLQRLCSRGHKNSESPAASDLPDEASERTEGDVGAAPRRKATRNLRRGAAGSRRG
ncbi:hypothetical protein GCM10020256_12090 [Streptomyces thermocoprophilus]